MSHYTVSPFLDVHTHVCTHALPHTAGLGVATDTVSPFLYVLTSTYTLDHPQMGVCPVYATGPAAYHPTEAEAGDWERDFPMVRYLTSYWPLRPAYYIPFSPAPNSHCNSWPCRFQTRPHDVLSHPRRALRPASHSAQLTLQLTSLCPCPFRCGRISPRPPPAPGTCQPWPAWTCGGPGASRQRPCRKVTSETPHISALVASPLLTSLLS